MSNFSPPSEKKIKQLEQKLIELKISKKDIKEKFIKSFGRGGQKLNKTSSCVQLTHIPSGIVVKCGKSRSQTLNRFLSLRTLIEKIEHSYGIETKKEIVIEKIRKQKRTREGKTKRNLSRLYSKVLFIAAVYEEVAFLIDNSSGIIKILDKEINFIENENRIAFYTLISGIGYSSTEKCLNAITETINPDIIIQVGIGGAFPASGFNIGDITIADKENFFYDEKLHSITNEEIKKTALSFQKKLKKNSIKSYLCSFLTVLEVTNSKEKAFELEKKNGVSIENMEGFALFSIASKLNIPFVEIRSVSNFVGEKDRTKWDYQTAFQNINAVLKIIERFNFRKEADKTNKLQGD